MAKRFGLAVASAAVILLAGESRGQDSGSSDPILPVCSTTASEESANGASVEPIVVTRAGEIVSIAGDSYHATAGAGCLRFETRAGGEPAAIEYRLRHVTMGDTVLFGPDESACAPSLEASRACFGRAAGLSEVYEGRGSGVEQLFVIEQRAAHGALEIRGRVTTTLAPKRVVGRGVVFVDASGFERLTYSEPVLIDAAGRAAAGSLTLDGDEVTLRFSAELLEQVEFPITVDPLIGANFAIATSSGDERYPRIAWNSVRDEYLVVYQTSTLNIRARRVSVAGATIGSAFDVSATFFVTERAPDVAYSPVSDRYAVVLEHQIDSGYRNIRMVSMSFDGTIVGSWTIAGFASNIATAEPTVVYLSNDRFLVTWTETNESANPDNQYIRALRIESDGDVVTGGTTIQTQNGTSTRFTRLEAAYNSTNDNIFWLYADVSGPNPAPIERRLAPHKG